MKLIKQIKKRISLYIIFALPGLIIFYPVLFGGEIFADGDAVLQLYPALDFFQRSLQSGESYIWNSHSMTGFVTAAGLMGGFFSRINQLVYQIFSVTAGYAWLTFLSFWLTSVFVYELSSKMGLKNLTGIFAVFIFPWIGANFIWAGNMTVISGLFLLPLLLYLFLVFNDKRGIFRNLIISIISGLLVGSVLITAHFQWAFQIFLTVGVWAIFLDWRARRVRVLVWAGIMSVIAGIVAWSQYQWLFKLLPFSHRAEGLSFHEIASGMVLPGDFLSLIFPNLSVPNIVAHPGFLYIGAVPILLFILSWFGKKDFYYRFFTILLVVSFLLSFRYSPLAWIFHELPGFSSFRSLSRFMYLGLFSATIMAAYGFESLLLKEKFGLLKLKQWLWRLALAIFGVFMVGSLTLGLYGDQIRQQIYNYFETNYSPSELTLPLDHYYQVIDRIFYGISSGSTFPNIPITVSIFSLVIAAGILRYSDKLRREGMAVGLVVLTVFNLSLINISLFSTRTVAAQELLKPPPVVEYLRANNQADFRTITLFSGSAVFNLLDAPYGYEAKENVNLMKNLLVPNFNLLFEIDSLDYYDNLMDLRNSRLLAYLGSDRAQVEEKLAHYDIPFEQKIDKFLERLKVLSTYNVKYIITAYPLEHSDLTKVYEWQATSYDIPLYLYELSGVKPRYYFANKIEFTNLSIGEDLWNKNLEAIKNDETLIECENCPSVETGEGELVLKDQQNGKFVFEVKTTSPQLFIFGQSFLPGWSAKIDGQSTDLYRANYVNQAILVPVGEHNIVFTFN